MDVLNRGILNIYVLEEFFRKNHHFMTDYEIMAIIRRIDTEGDAQITFVEFVEFMNSDSELPLSRTAPIAVYNPPYRSIAADMYPYYSYPYHYRTTYYPYSSPLHSTPRATSSILKTPRATVV